MRALTLLEAAKLAGAPALTTQIIEIMAKTAPLLAEFPFKTVVGGANIFTREDTLPSTAFRAVNGSYTASEGQMERVVDEVKIAGGDLDVDVAIVKTRGQLVRAAHEAMKAKKLAENIQLALLKGDPATTPNEFAGLQALLTSGQPLAGTQLIANGATSGGDPLSIKKLHDLIDAVYGATHLIMNRSMRTWLTMAASNTGVGGYITRTVNEFGQVVEKFRERKILVVETMDGQDSVLPFSEANPGGGSSVGTSIYAANIGDGGWVGIQGGPLEVRDLGELQTAPVYRTRVEWLCAHSVEHKRGVGRLWGITNAAPTV